MTGAVTPLFLTREQAAQAANVSVDLIAAAINAGTLRAKRTGANGGGKILVDPAELRAWFDGLVDA